jgi:hypothetical protein
MGGCPQLLLSYFFLWVGVLSYFSGCPYMSSVTFEVNC